MRLPFFFSSLFILAVSPPAANEWAKVIRPKKANALAQNISDYAAGCLREAEALPITGNGYSGDAIIGSAFLGHPDLPGFGEKIGNAATQQHGGCVDNWRTGSSARSLL